MVAQLERDAAVAERHEMTHDMTGSQVEALHARFNAIDPALSSSTSGDVQALLDSVLPKGAAWSSPRPGSEVVARRHMMRRQAAGNVFGTDSGWSGSSSVTTPQRPYQPEFDSPDRQHYPTHRVLANRYWRMFFKLDNIAGPVTEMISDLPYSDFQLSGEGVDGEIKDTYETMCDEVNLRSLMPKMTREFLVVGEACPHLFYDDVERIWTYCALHNPDQLEVIHSPLLPMQPIVQFMPDERLREIVTSSHPMISQVRESMPPDLVRRVMAREPITLHPLNFTLIARKMHDYDVRGTSIFSRLWRAFMLEDAVFSAAIATARRMATPLKVAKLGDASSNWIPPPDQHRKLLSLIAQQEADPGAWLVWHFGLNFELVGVQERVLPITQYYPLIEQIKLAALGVSKAFISGETSYSSAAAGLTVFIQRLHGLRGYMESSWLYPKFFRPIAEMNGWIKPTQAELSHRVRVKRSKTELRERNRYIVPEVKWERSLDPNVDNERVSAIVSLEGIGMKFSKRTKMACVGADYETELKQIKAEVELEREVIGNDTAAAMAAGLIQPPGAEGGGGGGGGGGAPALPMPGVPPESLGGLYPGDPNAPASGGAGDAGAAGAQTVDLAPGGAPASPSPAGASTQKADDAKAKPSQKRERQDEATPGAQNWDQPTLNSVIRLFTSFDANINEDPWADMLRDSAEVGAALEAQDPLALWGAVEGWLLDNGYPDAAILELQGVLESRGVRVSMTAQLVGEPRDSMSALTFTGVGQTRSRRRLLSGR